MVSGFPPAGAQTRENPFSDAPVEFTTTMLPHASNGAPTRASGRVMSFALKAIGVLTGLSLIFNLPSGIPKQQKVLPLVEIDRDP